MTHSSSKSVEGENIYAWFVKGYLTAKTRHCVRLCTKVLMAMALMPLVAISEEVNQTDIVSFDYENADGSAIVRENAKRFHSGTGRGFSMSQRTMLQEKQQGKVLTFKNGVVEDVVVHEAEHSDYDTAVIVAFQDFLEYGEGNFVPKFRVKAFVMGDEMRSLVKQLSPGTRVSTVTGRVRRPDTFPFGEFQIEDAKVILEGELKKSKEVVADAVSAYDILHTISGWLNGEKTNAQVNDFCQKIKGRPFLFLNGRFSGAHKNILTGNLRVELSFEVDGTDVLLGFEVNDKSIFDQLIDIDKGRCIPVAKGTANGEMGLMGFEFEKAQLILSLNQLILSLNMVKEEKIGVVSWSFDIEDGKASVTKANPATGSIVIPDRLGGYPVMSIGEKAFMRCDRLTSVTIPEGVTSIGATAFALCSGLTNVSIPSSVTSIGNEAFSGCSGLASVTIPNSVTNIGNEAFSGCSGLASVTIPSGVTNIGAWAFHNCSGLTTVTIPQSVRSIGVSAFGDCSGLTRVTIPSSVTSIGDSVFNDCKGLTCITIPSSVTSIGKSAFCGCSGLKSVTIPSSVTDIGVSAFGDCSGLTNVAISEGVVRIRDSAFNGCTGLTHVTIPSSVKDIGESVFSGCCRLTSVESPSGTLKSFYGTPWYESEMHKRPMMRLAVIVIVSIIALVVALLMLKKAINDEKPSYYR